MAKKIEEKYKEMSEIEHVLNRPGMWVGSTKNEEHDMYVYNINSGKFEFKVVNYVPAMLKLVDEVISNSCDEYRRKDNMGLNMIEVNINKETSEIKVFDNGGIPITKHKDAKVYIPEFVFGRLRSSSNYNDDEDRIGVGTNGVGAGLTNCFSLNYIVDSADGKNKFHRSWSNNMVLNDDLKVEKCNKKDHYTKTTFKLDLKRFDVKELSDDFINIIHKRCIDAAAANPGLTVKFNSNNKYFNNNEQVWKFKSFDEYIDLYSNFLNTQDKITFKNDLCEAYIFPDSQVDIGFVNGAECSTGTHMRALRTPINSEIAEFLTKKDKIKDGLSPRSVENKYSVFMNIDVSNPSYSSQTKEELTTPIENFSKDNKKKWEVSDKFLKQIVKSEITELVRDWYKKKLVAEDEKTLRKLNKEATKKLCRPDKFVTCTSKRKGEKQLWIFEGDSAASGFRGCRNPNIQAGYVMRGVPKNIFDLTPVQIMKNEVFNDIVSILGLKFGKEFDINDLNFGKIVISSDMDSDGHHIAGLLLLFLNTWPELFEKKIICRSISPIIIATKGKDVRNYYNVEDYKADEKKLKGYQFKYTKGLGGLNKRETTDMYQNPIFQYFVKDELTESMLKKWFGNDSDIRKSMLAED